MPERDSAALCNALYDLVVDPDRRVLLGQTARTRIHEFGWDTIGEKFSELIHEAAAFDPASGE